LRRTFIRQVELQFAPWWVISTT